MSAPTSPAARATPEMLVLEDILVETDTPELVVARDAAGTAYLALLVERSASGDRSLCVAVSASRLADICSGKVDLRDGFAKNENGEAFVGEYAFLDGRSTFAITPLAEIPEKWLPAVGFPLPQFLAAAPPGAPTP